jgi:hypothetical protein
MRFRLKRLGALVWGILTWFALVFDKYLGSVLARIVLNAILLSPVLVLLARWYEPALGFPPPTVDPLVHLYLSYGMPYFLLGYNLACTTIRNRLRKTSKLSVSEASRLLILLDEVVGLKAERFRTYLRDNPDYRSSHKSTIFNGITNPNSAYRALIEATHKFVDKSALPEEAGVRFVVVLARIQKDQIHKFETTFPRNRPPSADVTHFNSDDVLFRIALKKKKVVIVGDIEKELNKPEGKRRYKEIAGEPTTGSIICIPIKYVGTPEIPFVLSIYSSKRNFFPENRGEKERWESIAESLDIRFSVEYSLEKLSEKSD